MKLPFNNMFHIRESMFVLIFIVLFGCAAGTSKEYTSPEMDFASLRTLAVMPFSNLTNNKLASDRVRDTFINNFLSTGAVYVIPTGEVARGIMRAGVAVSEAPSSEEITKIAGIIKADAFITGVVREYGEVRSGSITGNIISISVQMIETQTQKVVWSASSTKGGIGFLDRLLGSGGEPMNDVTEAAVDDVINKLFK
jgi:TolB-like protein